MESTKGSHGQYNFNIDDSSWISSNINDPSPQYFLSGETYRLSFSDERFVEKLQLLATAVERSDIATCKEIAPKIRDINGIFHYSHLPSYTVLHKAVEKKNINVVKILLNHGADADIQNSLGETPRTLAAKINEPSIAALFKQKEEEILSTKEQEVKFMQVDFDSSNNLATYSAFVWFGCCSGEYARLYFGCVGEKYSELKDISINVKIEKVCRNKVEFLRFTTPSDYTMNVTPSNSEYVSFKNEIRNAYEG